MDKFWEFLKKNWLAVAIGVAIALFAVAGVPLIINWAFTVPALCDFFAVDWEAKDALAYYGSALGFIGTALFSGLALWQNHIIKTESDKRQELLDEMEVIKNAPHIVVQPTVVNGKASNLKMVIKNTSENIAEKIYASGFAIIDETGAALWRDDEVMTCEYLVNDRKMEVCWENPCVESNKHQFVFDLKFSDMFGNEYSYKAVGNFKDKVGIPNFKLTKL
ncbi:MAG: hypothetical protein E7432_09315 [Ruminococcaceae bacterium]|nr:hypothetical protein [Oscillospiraceae bacterium]